MAIHAGMKDWSELAVLVVTKDVAPGWNGPSTEKTFKAWRADLISWARICSYGDDHEGRISAVEFCYFACKSNLLVWPHTRTLRQSQCGAQVVNAAQRVNV